jgi:hypothetical protein
VVVLFIGMWMQERQKKAAEESGKPAETPEEGTKSELALSPVAPPEEARGD